MTKKSRRIRNRRRTQKRMSNLKTKRKLRPVEASIPLYSTKAMKNEGKIDSKSKPFRTRNVTPAAEVKSETEVKDSIFAAALTTLWGACESGIFSSNTQETFSSQTQTNERQQTPIPSKEPKPSPWKDIEVREAAFEEDISIDKIHQKIEKRLPDLIAWLEKLETDGKSFEMPFRKEPSQRILDVSDAQLAEHANIWFLGDIHGDILSLVSAFLFIEKMSREQNLPTPTYVFLGDITDRFKYSFETFFWILWSIFRENAGSILWLAGNHDELSVSDGENPYFTPTTSPSEFCDWLNSPPVDSSWSEEQTAQIRRLVQLSVPHLKTLPVALYLPTQILVAHGGVPMSICSQKFKNGTI